MVRVVTMPVAIEKVCTCSFIEPDRKICNVPCPNVKVLALTNKLMPYACPSSGLSEVWRLRLTLGLRFNNATAQINCRNRVYTPGVYVPCGNIVMDVGPIGIVRHNDADECDYEWLRELNIRWKECIKIKFIDNYKGELLTSLLL